MKFLNVALLLTFVFAAPSFSQAITKPGARPASKEVEAFSKTLKDLGLGGKVEGIKLLAEVRPNLNKVLDKVSKELKKAKAQEAIAQNKTQFDTLTENINAASAQAAEMRMNGKNYEGSASKLLDAVDALPGIMLEVANAGAKGDVQKALDVSRMLAELKERDLSNEADASAKRKAIEDRLGTDKEGKQITLEELIKRCLGA